jgi:predicted amidophosphoribosyltransferase
MLTALCNVISSQPQLFWNTQRVRLDRKWCSFIGHKPSLVCDSQSERLYTVCQGCGEESSGVTLHTVPVRHTWMRDRYELWLKYLETLRVPKSRAKMRLVSKA